MSQMSDPFLESIALGVNNMGQATQNWNVKAQAALQGQALRQQAASEANRAQMQQNELAAQAQMQQQAQAAQSADYAQLNASRERMAQQEMAQQQSQFESSQAQARELQMIQSKFALRMKQIDEQIRKVNAEAASGVRNSEEMRAFRAERTRLEREKIRTEEALNSTNATLSVAQQKKSGASTEVAARLAQFEEAIKTQASNAQGAFGASWEDFTLQTARDSGFWAEVGRVPSDVMGGLTALPPPMVSGPMVFASTSVGKILGQNLMESVFGYSDPKWYEERLADPLKNPGTMVASIVDNAFTKHGDAFGLRDGEKEAARMDFMKVLAMAEALRPGSGVTAGLNDKQAKAAKEGMAEALESLRGRGMSDAQIMTLVKGIEGLSENSASLIQGLAPSGADAAMTTVIEGTLTGAGRIADVIQDVASDPTFMKKGPLVDHSQYDFVKMHRTAMAGYALANDSPEVQGLLAEMDRVDMPTQERQELLALLAQGVGMNPEELTGMIEELGRRRAELGVQLGRTSEEEQLALQELLQNATAGGAQSSIDLLKQLEGEL